MLKWNYSKVVHLNDSVSKFCDALNGTFDKIIGSFEQKVVCKKKIFVLFLVDTGWYVALDATGKY